MTVDLRTRYLGLALAGPIVASPGPLTGRLDTLLRLEAAGASAVVSKLASADLLSTVKRLCVDPR